MLIARQKKQDNIAEYVVYMYQVEDMMRACKLDIETVKKNIISQYNQPQETIDEITYWYDNIIALMHNQKIEQKGHLQEVENIVDDLYELHLKLLRSPLHPDYKVAYQEAAPVIGQSIALTKADGASEIEVCFEMMYMILLLRLKKKEINNDTAFAVAKISRLLAILSEKYHKNEKDGLDF
ncbi:MAG: DUF4924 family protein [Bacteroidales bacterium]|nr:DUF4924 family protein [Bacteroidales bacterium]MBO7567883.1 DUF4924 family protein [Bacteroidales bacterium]MBP5681806.1 DUF4924 family protein [Bacteroidales bacterium]